MEKYSNSQLKTKLTSIANANNQDNLQTVFVNTVYQSLVMGNNMPDRMLAIRESAAPAAFKAALGKYLPLRFNKKTGAYEYSRTQAEKLRTELAIELTSEARCMTIDEVAAVLPVIFAKEEKTKADFNLAAYCDAVSKKLSKEGIANADMLGQILAALAAHPERLEAVSAALVAEATMQAA